MKFLMEVRRLTGILAWIALTARGATFASEAQPSADGCRAGSQQEGFLTRLANAYQSHIEWNGADPAAPAPTIAGGGEVPISNPPWPYSTWG